MNLVLVEASSLALQSRVFSVSKGPSLFSDIIEKHSEMVRGADEGIGATHAGTGDTADKSSVA